MIAIAHGSFVSSSGGSHGHYGSYNINIVRIAWPRITSITI